MTKRVIFFDLLRCVAAFAVITIHVLAPYRYGLGVIPDGQWMTAVTLNSVSRWAVPVFILISGALMLSDPRPFQWRYYLQRRLGKVVIPFLIWSLFYAYLSGWSARGFDLAMVWRSVVAFPQHETYYHLRFFYYFIPLYFIIPGLHWLVQRVDDGFWYVWVGAWLLTTWLYLCGIEGIWSQQWWLFSGYLPLGYLLYQKLPMNKLTVSVAVGFGIAALGITTYSVIHLSLQEGSYTVGRWLSYKTVNVVCVAVMVFVVCRAWAEKLPNALQTFIRVISQYSLGIYLLHPIFLWPMKTYGWYQGNPLWVIPLWVMLSGGGALAVSYLLSRSAKTRWLLP
ncbi:acyltransferase [Vibrio cincinnatiensis]|uniref:acyltransferase n=1 Tax=Vibrio cincinnatiensis TaxID=675 RepID=UPI001EDCA128|nr:acyltransferase family protein [Vibrio cincinnatiensis]MCG3766961.1 acyltransferase [Vibrio cincinnatiensis]